MISIVPFAWKMTEINTRWHFCEKKNNQVLDGCSDQPRLNCALKEILQRFLPVIVPSHLVERSCTVRVLMSKRFIDFLFSQGSKLTSHPEFVAVCNHCITHNPPPIHLILLSKVMYCALLRAPCGFLFRGALSFRIIVGAYPIRRKKLSAMNKNNNLQGNDYRYNVRVFLSTVGVKKG